MTSIAPLVAKLTALLVGLEAVRDGLRDMDADLEDALTPDEVWLARTIQGEGAALFGDQRDALARHIAWTVYSRMAKAWWPNTVRETVESAFHGVVNVRDPEPWALAVARECVLAYRRGQLQADGPLFMLSGADMETLDIDPGEARVVFTHGQYSMAFFDHDPFPKEREAADVEAFLRGQADANH